MFMSPSDSDLERSNISLKENKPAGVDLNSNGLDYCVRKNEEKFYAFQQTVDRFTNFNITLKKLPNETQFSKFYC